MFFLPFTETKTSLGLRFSLTAVTAVGVTGVALAPRAPILWFIAAAGWIVVDAPVQVEFPPSTMVF